MISSENSPVASDDANDREPLKIILAEDDKEDQELFIDAMDEAELAAEVTTVENGQELLDNLRDESQPNPDMIFIDINMPVKAGIKVLEEIKSDDELRDIPAVMLSTWDHPSYIEETFNKGGRPLCAETEFFCRFCADSKKGVLFALDKSFAGSG